MGNLLKLLQRDDPGAKYDIFLDFESKFSCSGSSIIMLKSLLSLLCVQNFLMHADADSKLCSSISPHSSNYTKTSRIQFQLKNVTLTTDENYPFTYSESWDDNVHLFQLYITCISLFLISEVVHWVCQSQCTQLPLITSKSRIIIFTRT